MSTTTAPIDTHPAPPTIVARLVALATTRARQGLVAGAVAVVGVGYWVHARGLEDTDDAQVDGDITSVAPSVGGNIVRVYVTENQFVHVGDPLADLDTRDLDAALARAGADVVRAQAQVATDDPAVQITETSNEAGLASASLEIASSEASLVATRRHVDRVAAELMRAEAADHQAALERGRAESLLRDESLPRADFESRDTAAMVSAATVGAIREEIAEARAVVAQQEARVAAARARYKELATNAPAQLKVRKAIVDGQRAGLKVAMANLAAAELNLSYTRIVSPVEGTIARKSVAVGDRVGPGQQLFAVSQICSLWVTANFRETQLARVRPGQSVDMSLDALDTNLHGTIESIGGATGARLSLFPPENAAGNFVKVVQRVPVRIRIDPGQVGLDRLRPGMSVEPRVHL